MTCSIYFFFFGPKTQLIATLIIVTATSLCANHANVSHSVFTTRGEFLPFSDFTQYWQLRVYFFLRVDGDYGASLAS